MDLSPLRKFEVTGPDAGELMQRTLTRNVRRMADHHVVYSAMCYEHGGMIDDGTLFRLSETGYRWIGYETQNCPDLYAAQPRSFGRHRLDGSGKPACRRDQLVQVHRRSRR